MKHPFLKKASISFLLAALCGATAFAEDPGTFKWSIGGGIHGDAAQVGKQLNGGIEEAWTRYQNAAAAAKGKQDELDAQMAAVVKTVHESPAYKGKLADETKAEAALKAARDQQNASLAIQLGSTVNQDKADLAKMEQTALATDAKLPRAQASLADALKKKSDAKLALNKTAEWRSRLIHSVRYGAVIPIPVPEGVEFCINSARVANADAQTITVEISAEEEVPGTEKKSARGDGIDVVTYKPHPIHVIIPRPDKCDAVRGSHVNIKTPYKLAGDFEYPGEIPTLHAKPDTDGKLAVLLNAMNDVKGPDKAYLDGVDDRVDKAEAKAMEQIDKGK
jgi:hypothetical protein